MTRRLLRRSLAILPLLSLVACAAVAALWVRSYWANDGWVYARPGAVSFGRLYRGKLMVMTVYREPAVHGVERVTWAAPVDWEQSPTGPAAFSASSGLQSPGWIPGFRRYAGTQDYFVRSREPGAEGRATVQQYPSRLTVVSCWLAFVAGLLPATPFVFRRLRRLIPRRLPGLCPRCGYDLRATPSRCPECGTAPAGVKA